MHLQAQSFQQMSKCLFTLAATSAKAVCLPCSAGASVSANVSVSVSVGVKTLRKSQHSTFSVTFQRNHRNAECRSSYSLGLGHFCNNVQQIMIYDIYNNMMTYYY